MAVVLLACGLGLWVGCDSQDDEAPGTVALVLDATIGAEALTFDAMGYANAAGNTYEVTHLEYILTDVVLERSAGESVGLTSAHYANPRMAGTDRVEPVDIPAGTYTGITFTYGVAGAQNVFGTLPRTAAFDGMLWPATMGGGTERYHNMRFEGRYQASNGLRGFLIHTGPTGGNDHSITRTLPLNLTVDGDAWEVVLTLDLNEWFEDPEVYDFDEVEGGIMGNLPVQQRLRANGATVFSVTATKAATR